MKKYIVISTSKGMILKFPCEAIRSTSRGSLGVKAIRLKEEDKVVSVNIVEEDEAQTQE